MPNTAPGNRATMDAAEEPRLLDDATMRQFLRDGSVTVQAGACPGLHDEICRRLESVFESEGNPGNNILPRVPELSQVFEDPAVRGALTSVLGPGYAMHPHRYGHLNRPGSSAQSLHKDSYGYSGDRNIRHHRSRWAMAFYYPQDVTPEMGPTAIIPGSHYYETRPRPDEHPELSLCGGAGTVTIVHFDIWHGATANRSDKKRFMLKFLFTRMEEPREPSWDVADAGGTMGGSGMPAGEHSVMWSHLWNWLRGEPGFDRQGQDVAPALVRGLGDPEETVRLQASYALGSAGEAAVPVLAEALRHEAEEVRRHAAYALSAVGEPAVPALIRSARDPSEAARIAAVDALGDMGRAAQPAVPALAGALSDASEWVRRHAARALGTIGAGAAAAVPGLAEALRDERPFVRFNAALALARIGTVAQTAVPALIGTLHDPDRYARAFAALALRRIGSVAAREALMEYLMAARWCPITTRENPY